MAGRRWRIMADQMKDQLNQLNRMYKEMDDIYRRQAARFDLSDAAFWVLYTLCREEAEISQNELCTMWFFPKQTVNSAINVLVKKEYVTLQQIPGTRNRKAVKLTDNGQKFCEQSIQPLIRAEDDSFIQMDAQERKIFLQLFRKQIDSMKKSRQSV